MIAALFLEQQLKDELPGIVDPVEICAPRATENCQPCDTALASREFAARAGRSVCSGHARRKRHGAS